MIAVLPLTPSLHINHTKSRASSIKSNCKSRCYGFMCFFQLSSFLLLKNIWQVYLVYMSNLRRNWDNLLVFDCMNSLIMYFNLKNKKLYDFYFLCLTFHCILGFILKYVLLVTVLQLGLWKVVLDFSKSLDICVSAHLASLYTQTNRYFHWKELELDWKSRLLKCKIDTHTSSHSSVT